MRLKLLSETASEFYATPNLRLRCKPEDAETTRARHVCQWVACEAFTPRYSKSAVARFWGMDRTAVFYGCKMVRKRIDTIPAEKRALKEFMKLVAERIKQSLK